MFINKTCLGFLSRLLQPYLIQPKKRDVILTLFVVICLVTLMKAASDLSLNKNFSSEDIFSDICALQYWAGCLPAYLAPQEQAVLHTAGEWQQNGVLLFGCNCPERQQWFLTT